MSKKYFNTVIFIFNKIKQLKYCYFYQKHTTTFLKQSNLTKYDDIKNNMNVYKMKILLLASVCSRFTLLHQHIEQKKQTQIN